MGDKTGEGLGTKQRGRGQNRGGVGDKTPTTDELKYAFSP